MTVLKVLLRRIKRLPKRKQAILGLVVFVVLIGIGAFIWAMVTGRIRPFAAGNEIANIATVSWQDSVGTNFSGQSNIVTTVLETPSPAVSPSPSGSPSTPSPSPVISPSSSLSPTPTPSPTPSPTPTPLVSPSPQNNVDLIIKLQGRTNSFASGINLSVYNAGTTDLVLEKTDVTSDSAGNASLNLDLPGTGYDFKLKVNMYLVKALKNITITNPLTLDFGTLLGGELYIDNIVNEFDYAILNGSWGKDDPRADLYPDHIINEFDYAILNSNWSKQGD